MIRRRHILQCPACGHRSEALIPPTVGVQRTCGGCGRRLLLTAAGEVNDDAALEQYAKEMGAESA